MAHCGFCSFSVAILQREAVILKSYSSSRVSTLVLVG